MISEIIIGHSLITPWEQLAISIMIVKLTSFVILQDPLTIN